MAAPRNQVAISGFADPYGKLSGTFKDLSTMYADKASKEKNAKLKEEELARQRALDLENSRRWGIERGDVLANRERETARDLENRRRWDLEQKRREDADLLAKTERDRVRRGEEVLWDVTNAKNEYSLDAYPEIVRGNITDALKRINDDEALTIGFLDRNPQGPERAAALNRIVQNRRNLYSSLNEEERDKKASEFITRLDALSRELGTIPMPNARKDRIEMFKQNQYGTLRNRIEERIKSGDALTLEEKTDYLFRQLTPEQRAVANPGVLREAIKASAKGMSRADMIASESANIERLEKLDQQRIDNLLKWEKDGFSDKPTVASATAADKSINELDIGGIDTANARSVYNKIKAAGVAPAFAASFVLGKIDTNIFGSSFVDPTSKEAQEYILEAKAAYDKMRETYGSGRRTLSENQVTPKIRIPRGLQEIQLSRFNVEQGVNPIRVTPKYLEELTSRIPAAAAKASTNVPVAALPPAESNTPASIREGALSSTEGSRLAALRARTLAREELNRLRAEREALPGFSGRGSANMLNNKRAELDEQIRVANARLDAIQEAFRKRRSN